MASDVIVEHSRFEADYLDDVEILDCQEVSISNECSEQKRGNSLV